jgi:hypothetical protein
MQRVGAAAGESMATVNRVRETCSAVRLVKPTRLDHFGKKFFPFDIAEHFAHVDVNQGHKKNGFEAVAWFGTHASSEHEETWRAPSHLCATDIVTHLCVCVLMSAIFGVDNAGKRKAPGKSGPVDEKCAMMHGHNKEDVADDVGEDNDRPPLQKQIKLVVGTSTTRVVCKTLHSNVVTTRSTGTNGTMSLSAPVSASHSVVEHYDFSVLPAGGSDFQTTLDLKWSFSLQSTNTPSINCAIAPFVRVLTIL